VFALIIAGGRGERLRPLTDVIPKPMVQVLGKPILWHQVEWLKTHGITDVVFLLRYKWEAVKDYFGDGERFGFKAHYNIEEVPLGRGGALREGLRNHVPLSEPLVIAINGDIVSKEDLSAMIRQHRQSGDIATVMLAPLRSPYAVVELGDRNRITGFKEKPLLDIWINGGVYVLDRNVESLLPESGDHEDRTFPHLATSGQLGGFVSRVPWRSIDSFKDLREAEEQLRKTA
jgi:NDP-sugar pyrophosphorylase family protein